MRGRRIAGSTLLVLAVLAATVESGNTEVESSRSAACNPSFTFHDAGTGYDGSMGKVVAPARNRAWASGAWCDCFHGYYWGMVQRWNGDRWLNLRGPWGHTEGSNHDVDASSARDVWVVGHDSSPRDYDETIRPFVARWDGQRWTRMRSMSWIESLEAVAVIGPDDVWVAGGTYVSYTRKLQHWDGVDWSVVPSSKAGTIHALDASGPADVWAVGARGDGRRTVPHIQRWDGHEWFIVEPPPTGHEAALYDVYARTPDDVWAVGGTAREAAGDYEALIMHWNGQRWRVLPAPEVGSLYGVDGTAADDVWAVSAYDGVIRWDGERWTRLGGPTFITTYGIATDPAGSVWIVGHDSTARYCPVQIGDGGFSRFRPKVRPGQTVVWRVRPSSDKHHRIRDATGLGLFDFPPRDGGGYFSFRFTAAGTYRVTDPASEGAMRVRVMPRPRPRKGNADTRFVIKWATAAAEDGYVYDVQRVDRASGSRSWLSGVTSPLAAFYPPSTGRFGFRARLRNESGASSGWSPTAWINVRE